MENLIRFFVSLTGDQAVGGWLVMLFSATATFFLVVALYFLIFGLYNPVRSRLHQLSGDPNQHNRFLRNATHQLGNYFVIRERSGDKLSYDRERLLHAGYHNKNDLANFYGIKIMLTLFLPLLAFVICIVFFPGISNNLLLLSICAGLLFGYIAPSFYLDKKVEKRKRLIRNAFPDAIDQLIVCTEAGLGWDASLQRVARDIALSNEIMGYELGLVNAELRAGVSREQSLKNLVLRTGVEEIRGLTTALTQAMRFGSSIGNTLRVYAEELRDKRMQRAEEEAAKLAVKMLFPLAFCFFPGIFIVILGPAVISIYTSFASM